MTTHDDYGPYLPFGPPEPELPEEWEKARGRGLATSQHREERASSPTEPRLKPQELLRLALADVWDPVERKRILKQHRLAYERAAASMPATPPEEPITNWCPPPRSWK